MIQDMRAQTQIHWDKGYSKKKTHFLGPEQGDYCKQLSETAGIENIPNIVLSIFNNHVETFKKEPLKFRKYRYTISNGNKFDKTYYG